jgi:hypothetical protein
VTAAPERTRSATDVRPLPADRSAAAHRFNTVVGALAVLAYVLALALAMDRLSYDIWGALVVAPVLVVVTLPLLARAGRRESDPWILRLLVIAFFAKLVGACVRYAVTFEVYAGRADAGGYHGSGTRLAGAFWDGRWEQVYRQELPELVGTEFMRLATGAVYIVTGPTKLGGFLVFSWLSFLGLFWFYRAFRVGFPAGEHRRYAVLLFFLPSLLYWPSSIGKEAWMLCWLGLAAYGSALVLRSRTGGFLLLATGLLGMALVRPHVAMLTVVALLVASLVRRRPAGEAHFGMFSRLAGLAIVIAMAGVLLAQVSSFFNLDDVDQEAVTSVLDRTEGQSAQGGSEFSSSRPKSPTEFPGAVVTVLFRPFPWEAGNAQALVAAAEGVVLLALFVLALPRLARLPRTMFTTPYVTFAVAFTLMFVFAFSSIVNFGIIARQRTQVFPLALVVLAIPLARGARSVRPGAPDRPASGDQVLAGRGPERPADVPPASTSR